MTHKPSIEAVTNFFSGVYIIGITCFDKRSLFNVITAVLFERSVLKEVRILRISMYLYNNSTMYNSNNQSSKIQFILVKFFTL